MNRKEHLQRLGELYGDSPAPVLSWYLDTSEREELKGSDEQFYAMLEAHIVYWMFPWCEAVSIIDKETAKSEVRNK